MRNANASGTLVSVHVHSPRHCGSGSRQLKVTLLSGMMNVAQLEHSQQSPSSHPHCKVFSPTETHEGPRSNVDVFYVAVGRTRSMTIHVIKLKQWRTIAVAM